jgi:hypothetical protein
VVLVGGEAKNFLDGRKCMGGADQIFWTGMVRVELISRIF